MMAAKPILDLIDPESNLQASPVVLDLMKDHSFKMDVLSERFQVTDVHLRVLFDCARLRFDFGEYEAAAYYLGIFRDLSPIDSELSNNALWGKFAGHILTMQWDEADKDREILRGMLIRSSTSSRSSEVEMLQQRSWLLHWSLFVFANHPKGKENLIDTFLQDININVIQLNCPWLLRYLAVAIITLKKRWGNNVKVLARLISNEQRGSNDPIIAFVEELLVNFNFDAAQRKLDACKSVIKTDFFLFSFSLTTIDEFMESARLLIFETYCRIHETIDLRQLAVRLGLSHEESEKWVVELIRSSQLDAKIDSTGQKVVMSVPQVSVHQQVIEKTRDLTVRTRLLGDAVEAASSLEGDARVLGSQYRNYAS
jgi:translation initiation factor 3 subunit E